jgi:uncharacterized ion transporter superfamily protein YfcC
MKQFQFPTAYTVILVLAIGVAGLTWVIPAGEFDRLKYDAQHQRFMRTGKDSLPYPADQATLEQLGVHVPLEKFTSGAIYKPIAIPGSFHYVKAQPQGPVDFLQSPLRGIMDAMDVILFVLILGGCIGVVHSSGAFDAGIARLASNLKGREMLLIIVVTVLIAAGGTTFGLAEETIAFYPILVPVFLAAGYDAMVALAVIYIGSSIGTMASTVNPFCSIIASNAAGINWTTGIVGRTFMLVAGTGICLWYIIRYAERVKKDPSSSLIFAQKAEIERMFFQPGSDGSAGQLGMRARLILLTFTACFAVMIYGVSRLDWWFMEMTTVFFAGAILIGFVSGIGERKFVEAFVKGAGELLSVALIIGVARGVALIMDKGMISDTLLYYASQTVGGMNKALFVNVLFYLYASLSFFISSSSGMAVLTMPIMAPLADAVGVGRERVVDAYMYGQGLFAFISPTGLILASLAMVNVGFDKFLKFVMPLVIILAVLCMVVLTVSVVTL